MTWHFSRLLSDSENNFGSPNMTTRRDFIRVASAATILSPALLRGESDKLGQILPQRVFGHTGEKVTAIGLGGAHVGRSETPKIAQQLVERGIEKGIRFFDTAVSYGNGLSEEYYGKFLTPKYRDQIFLTTKTLGRTAKEAEADFQDSLRRMKTDHLDLWQMHSFNSVQDVKDRIDNGVLDLFLEKREKKLARYIGFSGHKSQEAHCYFLDFCKEKGYKIDSCLMPVNLADPNYDSFIVNVLPKLQESNIGLQAMKTMVHGQILNYVDKVAPGVLTPKNIHEFVYSLPISTLISGCETIAHIDENTATLRNFKPLSEERRNELTDAVKDISGQGLEYYKRKV